MLFNSTIFIFLFLPITLILFYVARSLKLNSILILFLASLLFYSYWNPIYLPILILSIVANFLIGKSLYKNKRRFKLAVGIGLNLSLLGYFKYKNFFLDSINHIFNTSFEEIKIILPLGISFFTFQQIAYLVDQYKQKTKHYSFLNYSFFVSFFPQLIAGPIVHHGTMIPQLLKVNNIFKSLSIGISIFSIGLFKKIFLADQCGVYANQIFKTIPATLSIIDSWIGTIAYSLQLYIDFSAYSDMATGLAYMFGICLPINFNSPYQATSLIDFWRRWHITLSNFLRDYLYIPLGGNRNGEFKKHIYIFITMVIGGFWHGANYTFIIWGAIHGVFLIINHINRDHLKLLQNKSILNLIISKFLVLLIVTLAWVFFRAPSVLHATEMIGIMFGTNGLDITTIFSTKQLIALIGLSGLMLILPNTYSLFSKLKIVILEKNTIIKSYGLFQWKPSYLILIINLIIFSLIVLNLSGKSEFLYYEF